MQDDKDKNETYEINNTSIQNDEKNSEDNIKEIKTENSNLKIKI